MDLPLTTQSRPPQSGGAPEQMVILLHGLGANGLDLIGLADAWATLLPDAVFLSPDAPYPCDMAPVGYQWFSLQEWTPESILRGVTEAAPLLNDYIDKALQHYDLKDENLALVGFSQGTMMSLYAGPRRARKIAGILGYSGALVGGEELLEAGAADSAGTDIQKPPIHLIHGQADPVVPVAAWHHAKEGLAAAGFTVTGHTTPGLPHGIDNDGIESGGRFLQKIF